VSSPGRERVVVPLVAHGAPARRYVVFRMGGVECGIEARHVRRAIPAPLGLGREVVVLGQAHPVIDLRPRAAPAGPQPGRVVLLVEGGSGRAGLLVDALTDLLLIEDAAVAPSAGLFGGIEQQWFEGVARLGSRVVMLLRLDAILAAHAVLPSRPAASG